MHVVVAWCHYLRMQSFGLLFALALLAVGALLNIAVLAYFLVRSLMILSHRTGQQKASARLALASMHR